VSLGGRAGAAGTIEPGRVAGAAGAEGQVDLGPVSLAGTASARGAVTPQRIGGVAKAGGHVDFGLVSLGGRAGAAGTIEPGRVAGAAGAEGQVDLGPVSLAGTASARGAVTPQRIGGVAKAEGHVDLGLVSLGGRAYAAGELSRDRSARGMAGASGAIRTPIGELDGHAVVAFDRGLAAEAGGRAGMLPPASLHVDMRRLEVTSRLGPTMFRTRPFGVDFDITGGLLPPLTIGSPRTLRFRRLL
jgi:hypothetical protein